MAYENKNLAGMGYDPFAFDFASYLELTRIVTPPAGSDQLEVPLIQEKQRQDYIDYLTGSPDSDVKRLQVRVTNLGRLGLSNVVEAQDEIGALGTVVANVSRAFTYAGMDLHDFSFVTAHVALDAQLFLEGEAARAKGLDWCIRHTKYLMDPKLAYDTFTTSQANALDLDSSVLWAEFEHLTATS